MTTGWRGGVFIVDDNFIGNKKKLKAEILPAIIEWKKKKKFPFAFCTEASINLADDEELMQLMVTAGFDIVFVGIETPNENSLAECTKAQNQQPRPGGFGQEIAAIRARSPGWFHRWFR